MSPSPVPAPIADSVAALLADRASRPPPLLRLALLAAAVALPALPLVRVPVTLRAPGMIRPVIDRQVVRAATSGRVAQLHAREGDLVRSGALLVTVVPDGAEEEERALRHEEEHAEAERRDLVRLLALSVAGANMELDGADSPRLQRFRHELRELRQQVMHGRQRLAWLDAELERARALEQRGLLPRMDVDRTSSDRERAAAEVALLVERARGGWYRSLAHAEEDLDRIRQRRDLLLAEAERARLRAPVSGTVERLAPLLPGARVERQDELVVISPDTLLVAEFHVPAEVVGLLRVGGAVRVSFRAPAEGGRGFVRGRIREIDPDARLVDGRPAFRVRAALDRARRSSAGRGPLRLRKGTAVQGHFPVARPTLWQLLRGRVTDPGSLGGGR